MNALIEKSDKSNLSRIFERKFSCDFDHQLVVENGMIARKGIWTREKTLSAIIPLELMVELAFFCLLLSSGNDHCATLICSPYEQASISLM